MPAPLLPKKAIRLCQLSFKTSVDSSPTKSAHEVRAAAFKDEQGDDVAGFFKSVTSIESNPNNYPVLLAKYDVAISVFMRMWLGQDAAEDRLVFNDEGQIVGTFSEKLANYKPMLSFNQSKPTDPQEAEWVCPTDPKTLLKYNAARFLTAAWGMGDPDRHPDNFSLFGYLDYDESLPHFTLIIKGSEGWETLVLNKPQILTGEDLDNFPVLKFNRKHWPTNLLPMNGNVLKQFQSYNLFANIPAISHIRMAIMPDVEISFQEQMFESLLTMLMVYDRETLSERLKEYFGGEPLDFHSLPIDRAEALSKKSPELFNEKTDKGLFIHHIQQVFQQQYDELYRAVVFYSGCEQNNWSNSVPSFQDFLRNRPSAQKKVIYWALEQNKLFAFSKKTQFQESNLEERYHQIWRDAHLKQFYLIWRDLVQLEREVADTIGIHMPAVMTEKSINKIDDKITESWQVIENLHQEELEEIPVFNEPGNTMIERFNALVKFVKSFTDESQKYFKWPRHGSDLLVVNGEYCFKLLELLNTYGSTIEHGQNDLLATTFSKLWGSIHTLSGELQLRAHRNDNALNAPVQYNYTLLLTRPHTDLEVLNTFIDCFFDWANSMDKMDLMGLIYHIIKHAYLAPTFKLGTVEIHNPFSNRTRGEAISRFLKEQEECDTNGANILAYIFSTGGHESTSLNTCIVKTLLPIVLKGTMGFGGIKDVNLMSLSNVLSSGEDKVNYIYYTEKIIQYVRTAPQFMDTYSWVSQEHLNRAMYRWVNTLNPKQFTQMVESALIKYEPENEPNASYGTKIYGFFHERICNAIGSKSRREEIQGYLKQLAENKLSQANVLGCIFKNGGIEEATTVTKRSFNVWLFENVFAEMSKNIHQDAERWNIDDDYRVVLEIDKEQAMQYIKFASFRQYAEEYSRQTRTEAETSTAEMDSNNIALSCAVNIS